MSFQLWCIILNHLREPFSSLSLSPQLSVPLKKTLLTHVWKHHKTSVSLPQQLDSTHLFNKTAHLHYLGKNIGQNHKQAIFLLFN